MIGRMTGDDSPTPSRCLPVIIVNYGIAALAIEAVESALSQQVPDRRIVVHVVDNASPGDDARFLAETILEKGWQDRVTLWPETVNHGFGRGNNLVLAALAAQPSPPDYVFLLNPDATLEQGALARLSALLDTRAEVVGVGAGISGPDGTPATAAFRFPSILGEFETAACFGPISRMLRNHRIPLSPDHPEGPVDWVAGAAVLFRLDALRKVGFFDPAFFLYFEEVDLMRRLYARGGVIWYLPSARAQHVEGATTGVTSGMKRRKPVYWFKSWSLYHCRASSPRLALITALAHLTGTVVNRLQTGIRRTQPNHPPRYIRDFVSGALAPLIWRRQVAHE